MWGLHSPRYRVARSGLDAHLYGFDECLPAGVTVRAEVAHQTADVSESDLVIRVGDAEPATGAGVPEGPRSKARHAGRGQLVAKTEADVGPGCAAFDECLDLIGAGPSRPTGPRSGSGSGTSANCPAWFRAALQL